MRFIVLLLAFAIISALVTLYLQQIKVRWIKYIPAVLFTLLALIMIIMADSRRGEGMKDLAWIIIAMLFISAALGSVIMNIVLYGIARRREQKQNE